VNTFTDDTQFLPQIAMNGRGDFVIAWTSDSQDGDVFGVFAQRYTLRHHGHFDDDSCDAD
jgi:hypothetical protein